LSIAAAHQFGSDPMLTRHVIGAVDLAFLTRSRHLSPAFAALQNRIPRR
jgi:hypothetical protein